MAGKKKVLNFEKKEKSVAKTASKIPLVESTPQEAAKAESPKIIETSAFPQEASKEPKLVREETKEFVFTEKERLITTLTAGGVVMSFGLSFGGVLIAPASPGIGGLLATLGIVSCIGAFMARESI